MTQTYKLPPQHRIQLDDVYRDFADGLLTVKGALFYAVAVSRKLGNAVQFNVSEFLERTGVHKGSYARALAALIQERRLDFPPNSTQTLRIPVSDGTDEPIYYSLDTSRSQICDRSQQICDRSQQICDRSQQICDRSQQICSDEPSKAPTDVPLEVPSISLSSLSFSLSSGEREEDAAPDEYEEWLTKKALQLPTPPTFMQEWLEKNRNKKSNRKEFFKYKKIRDEASVPVPAATAIFEKEAETEAQQRLGLMRHWWASGSQEKVRTTITAHPEWRLRVGEAGPEEVQS